MGGGVSSYMAVGTDMCLEWPPFSGMEIYLWVYFFIPKYMYMNTPSFQTACMNDNISLT